MVDISLHPSVLPSSLCLRGSPEEGRFSAGLGERLQAALDTALAQTGLR